MRLRALQRTALASAAMVLSACGGAATTGAPSAAVGPAVGNLAPPVEGTSLQGHQVSVKTWRGSVTVILFWASWCGPCQAEQAGINAVAVQEIPQGVHFAGISVDADAAAAKGYLTKYAVPYDSLLDDTQTQALTLAFEVSGPPATFVISPRGRVTARIVGPVNPDDLRRDIAAASSAA